MKNGVLDVVLAVALLATVVSGFSYTWTPVIVPSVGGTLSMSADGRIICSVPSTGGKLCISRDGGQTWAVATNAAPSGSMSGSLVAFSANGSQIFACLSSNAPDNGLICRSTDFGTNWTKSNLPILPGLASYCVACSANGSNVIAGAGNGPLYFSTNGGSNWSTSSVATTGWWSLASSANGKRMVAAGAGMYFSTNFGASWTSNNFPARSLGLCISVDGQSIGAIGTNCYVSRDGGASWTTNGFNGDGIACSARGTIWIISAEGAHGTGTYYTSSDGGATWLTNSLPFSGIGVGSCSMSADGCEVATPETLGRITPSPKLDIQPQGTNVTISWILPSTNFVLQQTFDFGNPSWTAVSTAPALNLSDLQQEVTVSAPASNMFFRLIAQ